MPRPPPAPTGGFDDDRVADLPSQRQGPFLIPVQGAVGSRYTRDAGPTHGIDGGDLVTHEADGLRFRTDKDETALLDPLGEIRVLRQETVSRMDGHRIRDLRGTEDGGDMEITVLGLGRTDAYRLIGE